MALFKPDRVARGLNVSQPFWEQVDDFLYVIKNIIDEFSLMVRKEHSQSLRMSIVNLITAFVHYRDIVMGLIHDRVTSADDFKWQVQFKAAFKDF